MTKKNYRPPPQVSTHLEEKTLLAQFILEPEETGHFLLQKEFRPQEFQQEGRLALVMEHGWRAFRREGKLNLPIFLNAVEKQSIHDAPLVDHLGGREWVERLFLEPHQTLGVPLNEDCPGVLETLREKIIRRSAARAFYRYSHSIRDPKNNGADEIQNSIWQLQRLLDRGWEFGWGHIEHHVNHLRSAIQKQKSKKSPYIGLDFEFPVLAEKLNGLQNEFYLVAATSGMGKTSFVTQILWSVLNLQKNAHAIFLSLDLSAIDVTAKFVAHCAQIDLSYVKNPAIANISLEKKRQQAMQDVSLVKERMVIVDESRGPVFLEDLKKLVKGLRSNLEGEILVVVDTLDGLQVHDPEINSHLEQKVNLLSMEMKTLARAQQVAILATTGMLRYSKGRRPQLSELDHVVRLMYDPYVILTLYQDVKYDNDSPFQEWEWGDEGLMVPIVEGTVIKNKMGRDNEKLFYRFHERMARFKECVREENANYEAMIQNLDRHEKEKKNPVPKLQH